MEHKQETKGKPSNEEFWEKQRVLLEKWNAAWAKKEEKKEEAPKPKPKPKAPSPSVRWCEAGFGTICPNKADIHVFCDTDSLYYQQYVCIGCWKWNYLFEKPKDELPDGLRIFRILDDGKEVLEAGRIREVKQQAKAKVVKKEKKIPVSASFQRSTGFVFPGQGAQETGMTKDVQKLPAVQQLFATAQTVLGYNLAELCLNGPAEKLNSTEYSQPAMLIAGLAAVEKLRQSEPKVLENVTATGGLSLGEYTALVFAGALSVEDALRVVKVRGEAMSKAAQAEPGGMVSVVGLEDAKLKEVCEKAAILAQGDSKIKLICQIANYNFPKGRVISGHEQCIEKVIELANQAGALKSTKVFVSGAFHTELMSSASKALEAALKEITIKQPRIPVYANVTGEPYKSPDDIRHGLVQQLVSPVQWELCVNNLLRDGHETLYELGPRNQLAAMLRRQNAKAAKAMKNIMV